MSPETGRRFGPYEIQSRLGGGGMGHVFRAWDARLHREVAIKLLNHEYVMPGMRERFLREARAASALNHPNICTVFDIGEQDGDPYLVMELLEGETLKDRISARTMQVDEIVLIARESAEALGAAHAKGVIHRDVKPANIFLVDKPNGGIQSKVLDFGLAKIEGGALGARGRSLELTTIGATVGTLAYMSPEQARGEVLDSRSDLFSLGVVLYEMATRHVPFQGATSALVFVQLLNHPPEPVREWNESVPRDLEKIIFKLLAKERAARFQTAREVELALIALSEKSSSGGWLRKAVSTVPLVRAVDPIAREKRLSRNSSSISHPERDQARPSAPFTEDNGERPRSAGPRAHAGNQTSDQVLRPVARVPRLDSSSAPAPRTPIPETGRTPLSSPQDLSPRTPYPASPQNLVEPVALGTSSQSGESVRSQSREDEDEQQGAHLDSLGAFAPEDVDEHQPPMNPGVFPTLFEPERRRSLPPGIKPVWLGVGVAAVVVLAIAGYFLLNRSRFGAPLLNKNDVIVVTEIENQTGDKILDASVAEGLRIALAQSPYFTSSSSGSYEFALRQPANVSVGGGESRGQLVARHAASKLNARAYVYGTITRDSAPYLLHADARDVATNEILASVDAHADNLQQIGGAIDESAVGLRQALGEPRQLIDQNSTGLAHEGSSNLAALQLYAQSGSLLAAQESIAALADLQQAVVLDPRYIQAHLRLAALYHALYAETAAADSARRALTAADTAGERTRRFAQIAYETETTGDSQRAITLLRQQLASSPNDAEALTQLAQHLVSQGHMAEALQTAQQAYASDPFQATAYAAAQRALLGLDRYDAAFQLDTQVQHLGMAHPDTSLAAAYLDGRHDVVEALTLRIPLGKMEYRPDWTYGLYLDNEGHLAAGAGLWRARAQAAGDIGSLKSAATFLSAQAALDRALLGDCKASQSMMEDGGVSHGAGPEALFNSGMAEALCGDVTHAEQLAVELRQRFPQNSNVKAFYGADLEAAIDLRRGDPSAALDALRPARSYDLISLTPYLRGVAHVATHEVAIGIVDFQTVLSHRGLAFILGDTVYPAAQLGVARAFASTGDLGNSAEAYRRFLVLWSTADPNSPILNEARVHSGL